MRPRKPRAPAPSGLRRAGVAAFALAAFSLAGTGCSPDGGRAPARASEAPPPPVRVVARAFYPRPPGEDWVERVPLAEVGEEFTLIVRPQLRTPHEGPWKASFVHADGDTLARLAGLGVDVATGHFTFLCRTDRFRPGDWTLALDLEPGGRTAGPSRHAWAFRVEE